MKSRKIRLKLIGSVFLVSFIATSLVGLVAFFEQRSSILQDTEISLQLLSNAKKLQIETFFHSLQNRAVDFASDGFIREHAQMLSTEANSEIQHELAVHLAENKLPIDDRVVSIEVFDPHGQLLVSTDPTQTIDIDLEMDQWSAIPSTSAILSPIGLHSSENLQTPTVIAVAPITDLQTGERIGYVANHMELDMLERILSGETQEGVSDTSFGWSALETTLVNEEGVVLSMSHGSPPTEEFIDLAVFNGYCTSTPGIHAYKNHHGVSVVGMARCLDSGMNVVVEIPSEEIFSSLIEGLQRIVWFSLALVFVITMISLFPIHWIIRPLESLRASMVSFKDGSAMTPFSHDRHDEIGELTTTFQTLAKQIQQTEQRRREFVSILSHQLRTPLTAMRLYLELLCEGREPQDDQQAEYLSNIKQSLDRAIHLIGDLTNISRIESGQIQLKPEPTNIEMLIQRVVEEMKPISEQANCTIRVKANTGIPEIPLDQEFFHQVMHNLVLNAIKYRKPTEEACAVEVFIDVQKEQQEKWVRIRVKDSGIGIAEMEKSRIFEKFFRSDRAKRASTEGAGLGLYVAKKILDQTGGHISFVSEEGIGSVFTVKVPVSGQNVS